jgi:hypothetical protein
MSTRIFFDVFRNDGVFLLPFIRAGFHILVCVVMIAMIVATSGYFRKNKWPSTISTGKSGNGSKQWK